MTRAQFVVSCSRLRGIAKKLSSGKKLTREEIVFLNEIPDALLAHDQEWMDAMKRQEDNADLAAVHAASWRPE